MINLEQHTLLEMTDEQLDRFASKTSDYLFKKMKSDKKKNKSNALYNTKELMENYNLLKKRSNETVHDVKESDHDDFWTHGRLSVTSLMVNRAKTVKIMNYVDEALKNYKILCDASSQSNKSRRHTILYKMYVEEQSIEFISGYFDKDRTTILRNRDEALQEFSILLFGIDILDM